MKNWLLKLIEHKIRVHPVVIKDETGNIVKIIWHAKKRDHDMEAQGEDPVTAAKSLVEKLENQASNG